MRWVSPPASSMSRRVTAMPPGRASPNIPTSRRSPSPAHPGADAFRERFIALPKSIRLGDPLDEATEMGPLTSRQHQERVLHFAKVAREEGGEILLGGKAAERED